MIYFLSKDRMNKRPYTTPDGYFDYLQIRLSQIPQRQEQLQEVPEVRVSRWARITPYFALVACFAVAIVAGRFILDKTASQPQAEDYVTLEQLYYADLIPYTSQYPLFEENYGSQDAYSYEVTEEDIINYLINTNVPLNYIGQYIYQ